MHHSLFNRVAIVTVILLSSAFFFTSGIRSVIFHGDALGYYLYLPSTFIYHNLETPEVLPTDRDLDYGIISGINEYKNRKTGIGKTIIQYTYGVAFMEMPFFFIAHAYEKITGRRANGFSYTYSFLVKISTLFYALAGLCLTYKILTHYFSATQSLYTTLLVYAGTNLFWFTLFQAGMSHVPLFFLYALLVYLTMQVLKTPSVRLFIAMGLTAGMITVIRPTDIVCVMIPLLYNVYNMETLKKKIAFIKGNGVGILVAGAAFLLPAVPQLLYWKMVAGHYLYYSYGSQSFDWLHPKIVEGLFCFSNGWLPYSPVMIFSILGLIVYRYFKQWAWCIWIILPVYVYIIYSWYCYKYINGLGSRPMIHLLSVACLAFRGLYIVHIEAKVVDKIGFCSYLPLFCCNEHFLLCAAGAGIDLERGV